MKRMVKASATTPSGYKNNWAYQQTAKNYPVDVKVNGDQSAHIIIWFDEDKDDKYAEFEIKKVKVADEYSYIVRLLDDYGGDCITEDLEFTDTMDECIQGCFYYFQSRF